MEDTNIKIYVVTHKKRKFKLENYYIPIQVGKLFSKEELGYLSDDHGDNIAEKNKNYSELTALYWIWKNETNANILGLCHYRRFFTTNKFSNNEKFFITDLEVKKILKKYDIIIPKKIYCGSANVRGRFSQGNGKDKDLDIAGKVINEYTPDYTDAFNNILNSNSASYYNMLIANSEIFKDYCKWLFTILFEMEKRVDLTNYNNQEKRIYGYVSEILLNVWIKKNNLKVKEFHIINTESDLKTKMKDPVHNTLKRMRIK